MRAVWFVLISLALAGCLSDDTPGTSDSDLGTPDDGSSGDEGISGPFKDSNGWTLPWEFRDCRFVYGQIPAIASAVMESLPAGFTPVTDAQGRVPVGFEANQCPDPNSSGGELVTDYTSVWVSVIPPAELAAEAGAGHFVNFDIIEKNETRRSLMQDSGVPAHDGDVRWTPVTLPEGSEQLIQVEIDMNTDNEIVFDIVAVLQGGSGAGAFDQWTPGTEGLTYWRTDWATSDNWQGRGTITIAESSPYRDWFESSVMPAGFNYGTWSYTSGKIIHPAPAA